jgi:exodeoxyribonuclease III
MRIVAWNCNGAFHRKIEALARLAPDIAIISECAEPETLRRKAPTFSPTSALWIGDNSQKGLGLFSFGDLRLSRDRSYDSSITYVLPARVEGSREFNVLAMWSHHPKMNQGTSSPGPTLIAIRTYERFLCERTSVIAGDLNNHVQWDRPRKASNHANAVSELDQIGFVSAYHEHHKVAHGAETHPTIYWRDRTETGPTYHIDYAFIPRSCVGLLRSLRIGSYADWIGTGLSDHAPVIVDFDSGWGSRS